ncbi:hypothetical protein L9F63_027394 [Diploptera punctata]|uniref:Uncharacterized protein n=1 Tax=Diploptera punctata TaxID=6984 RepID=A0AAD8ELK3_DIPPU|nr:hypothetical protein L9F63_027394 [Diploptera punctata]
MGEFLVWPETPKRKGKRQTEIHPFAITSDRYKDMFEKKKEEKRKIEEQKEERKRKREEKKQSKFPANKNHKFIPQIMLHRTRQIREMKFGN